MHPILLNLWLSSVPLWVGLSLSFLTGLGYYWFQLGNQNLRIFTGLQAFLRGLFLVGIVLCFFSWKITIEESKNLPTKVLLILDDSQSMNQPHFADFIQDVYQELKSKHQTSSEFKFVGLNNPISSIKEIIPRGTVSSWAKVQELIRKESKGYQLAQVYFVSDAQLSDLESPIHRGPKIHVVPFGKEKVQEEIGLNFPTKTLISVPGEQIHVPISVWSNLSSKQKSPNIQVLLDGRIIQTLKAPNGIWKAFQQVDLALSENKIGKHKVQVRIENNASVAQGFTWVIQEFQASVEAFAMGPNPNLGVINRVAEDAKIKLHWNFGSMATDLPKSDNYLFYGVLPKDLPKDKSVWYVNIPSELKKDWPQFEEFTHIGNYFSSVWKKNSEQRTSLLSSNTSLWKEQMAEMKNSGSYQLLDSSLHELFKISFLRQADDLVSVELANSQISLGDELVFEVRQLNLDLVQAKNVQMQWNISSSQSAKQFVRPLIEAHQIVTYKPNMAGKYQYQAKLTYQGKELEFNGEFLVDDSNPEKEIGRNNAALQVLAHHENVDILEAKEIKNQVVNTNELINEVSLKEINVWEWPYFGVLMLLILGLEWVIRKSLNQL